MKKIVVIAILLSVLVVSAEWKATAQETNQTTVQLPSYPLAFGVFALRFDSGGTLTIEGKGWPALNGKWKLTGSEIEMTMSGQPEGCGVGLNTNNMFLLATAVIGRSILPDPHQHRVIACSACGQNTAVR